MGGDDRGDEADHHCEEDDCGVSEGVHSRDLVEEAFDELAGDSGDEETGAQSKADEDGGLVEDHFGHALAGGAEGHADADFAAAVADDLGEYSIESGDEHEDGESGEGSGEVEAEALGEEAFVDDLLHGFEVIKSISWPKLMKDVADRGDHCNVAARFDDEVDDGVEQRGVKEGRRWDLLIGQEQEGLDVSADLVVGLIFDHTDDGVGLEHAGVFIAEIELLLQRVAGLEVLCGEGLIDDGDKGSSSCIRFGDHAAAEDGGVEGLGVVTGDGGDAGVGGRVCWLSEDLEAGADVKTGERRSGDEGRCLDAGQVAYAFEYRSIGEGSGGWWCDGGIADAHAGKAGGIRGHGAERGEALQFEAELRVLKVPERMEEQAGTDEQQRGKRNFADDEPVTETIAAGAGAESSGSGLEDGLRIGADDEKRGEERREQGGDGGDSGEGGENGPMHGDRVGAGDGAGGEFVDEAESALGEGQAANAAEQAEDTAFGEHLADEPGAAGAESNADTELLLAAESAGEQEIGDVGASDEEDEREGGYKRVERGADRSGEQPLIGNSG